jgi:glycosyltransferase involved in cell wall biosynthesis
MLKIPTQQVIDYGNAVSLLKRKQSLYTQWPSVGVVIPVRNSARTIRQCAESVLNQEYAGPLTIWIVGNPEDQDNTWAALGDLANDPRVHCIKLPRPADWYGRDAMLKRLRGCEAAFEAEVEMLALLDSQVSAPPDWLSKAVKLMIEHHVDGAAGISCKHPQDRSLSGI